MPRGRGHRVRLPVGEAPHPRPTGGPMRRTLSALRRGCRRARHRRRPGRLRHGHPHGRRATSRRRALPGHGRLGHARQAPRADRLARRRPRPRCSSPIGAGSQVVAVDDHSNYPADAPKTDLSGLQAERRGDRGKTSPTWSSSPTTSDKIVDQLTDAEDPGLPGAGGRRPSTTRTSRSTSSARSPATATRPRALASR